VPRRPIRSLDAENWSAEAPASEQNREELPRRLQRLANDAMVAEDGSHLQSRCKLEAPLCARVILAGRPTPPTMPLHF
jgi:hypothetical protein